MPFLFGLISGHQRKKNKTHSLIIIVALLSTLLLLLLHISVLKSSRRLEYEETGANSRPSPANKVKHLPQAIIIGARKCGTRALLRFLEVNPAIRPARNEIHFFDKPQNYKQGFDWYRDQMPETMLNEITIEKSPAYFVTSEVPERIKAMNSSIKLILILRDPVTRLISDFSQLVANRLEKSDDYDRDDYNSLNIGEQSVSNKSVWDEAEKEFENYVLRSDGGVDEQRRAVKIGMYSYYLERWLALFPRNQFHFVNGERLITEPHVELYKLEPFLGLKPAIRREHFVFNPRKGFFCLTANSTTERRHTGIKSTSMKGLICLSKSKGRRHVKVKKQLIEQLRDFYAPYNEYLYSLTGINFN